MVNAERFGHLSGLFSLNVLDRPPRSRGHVAGDSPESDPAGQKRPPRRSHWRREHRRQAAAVLERVERQLEGREPS